MPKIESDYLSDVFNVETLKERVAKITRFLRGKKIKDTFDAVAFRGMSGALVGPIIADRLSKPMLLIRKPESSHSSYKVEGDKNAKRYIIVDDLIETGTTIEEIKTRASAFNDGELIGIVLYSNGIGKGAKYHLERFAAKYNCWIYCVNCNPYYDLRLIK